MESASEGSGPLRNEPPDWRMQPCMHGTAAFLQPVRLAFLEKVSFCRNIFCLFSAYSTVSAEKSFYNEFQAVQRGRWVCMEQTACLPGA